MARKMRNLTAHEKSKVEAAAKQLFNEPTDEQGAYTLEAIEKCRDSLPEYLQPAWRIAIRAYHPQNGWVKDGDDSDPLQKVEVDAKENPAYPRTQHKVSKWRRIGNTAGAMVATTVGAAGGAMYSALNIQPPPARQTADEAGDAAVEAHTRQHGQVPFKEAKLIYNEASAAAQREIADERLERFGKDVGKAGIGAAKGGGAALGASLLPLVVIPAVRRKILQKPFLGKETEFEFSESKIWKIVVNDKGTKLRIYPSNNVKTLDVSKPIYAHFDEQMEHNDRIELVRITHSDFYSPTPIEPEHITVKLPRSRKLGKITPGQVVEVLVKSGYIRSEDAQEIKADLDAITDHEHTIAYKKGHAKQEVVRG